MIKTFSSLEKQIFHILTNEGIKFVSEHKFPDLRNGLYRFDFWIPSLRIAIEAQGMQHYQYLKVFHKKRSDFLKAQERDRRKISYCLAHKIKLYCLPCWDFNNIKTFADITQDKYLAKNHFHNDDAYRNQKNRE